MNGASLRGLTMEEARNLLRSCEGEVDIIIARDPDKEGTAGVAPVERRKRRKLPTIERPGSAGSVPTTPTPRYDPGQDTNNRRQIFAGVERRVSCICFDR